LLSPMPHGIRSRPATAGNCWRPCARRSVARPREDLVKVAFGSGAHYPKLQPERAHRDFDVFRNDLGARRIGVHEQGNHAGRRHELAQQPQLFCPEFVGTRVHSRDIAAWPVEADDQSGRDRISGGPEDDRDRRCRRLGRAGRTRTSAGQDHRHWTANQLGGQRGHPIGGAGDRRRPSLDDCSPGIAGGGDKQILPLAIIRGAPPPKFTRPHLRWVRRKKIYDEIWSFAIGAGSRPRVPRIAATAVSRKQSDAI
jgi:hypothetical protein